MKYKRQKINIVFVICMGFGSALARKIDVHTNTSLYNNVSAVICPLLCHQHIEGRNLWRWDGNHRDDVGLCGCIDDIFDGLVADYTLCTKKPDGTVKEVLKK